jgi:hypothetical protein
MAQGRDDLWKQAYRAQFGTDADQDMAEHKDDVEAWRINWQSGYDAGEDWAKNMLQGSGQAMSGGQGMGGSQALAGGQMGSPQAPSLMRTFDDMSQVNARIREQYDAWRDQRASQGLDATDWDAFRNHLISQGSPDPGGRPPDDFVGEDYKQQHPEWMQRYGNRVA